MAGIPEDELVRLRVYPRLKTFLERLFGSGFGVNTWDFLPDYKEIPPMFRNIIQAMPYFQAGEPLYLYMYSF